MTTSNIYPLVITTLSPVHIGCDEIFEPTNFVIENGLLHVLDPANVAAALKENEKRQLLRLADERDPIGGIQQFFKKHRTCLAQAARQWVDVAPGIADEYEEKAGKPQQRSSDGRVVYNLFPMARTAFNPLDGAPYLPGSSLKGSIRTAWLNFQNERKPLIEKNENSARLQQRLMDYRMDKLENDPFRCLAVADAHVPADRMAPPTRIVYAVSKKKKPSERGSPELKVFLETVHETMAEAFAGELRLTGRIGWEALCDACNAFYRPQLESELDHELFRTLLDSRWRTLIKKLLASELGELMTARQGFLLRVGRHSGAESVTLDVVRSIKIKTPKGQPDERASTTEKRFASQKRTATDSLLPFGWVWVSSCDDAYQYLAMAVHHQISQHAAPVLEAHAERLAAADERAEKHAEEQREDLRRQADAEAARQAEAAAQAAYEQELAAMSVNRRKIREFRDFCRKRAGQLGKNREALNGDIHNRARQLIASAVGGAEWTAEEKCELADVITEWLPKLVARMDKDQLKKLKLSAMRGN